MSARYTGINAGSCSVEYCNNPAKYKGLCGKHYKRQWRHGDPSITKIDMGPKVTVCGCEGCNRVVYTNASGLCKVHYLRFWRYGRLDNIRFGWGYTDTNGYRVISIDGEKCYEHRYLAELALGKPLPEGAVVHHMNDDRSDNYTPFNLVICPDQAYHLLLHRRAVELGYIKKGDE